MNLISQTSSLNPKWENTSVSNESFQLQIYPQPCSTDVIVNNLASLEGPVDIYCWYEGTKGLPKSGADFMKEFIFEPLYNLKKDSKIYLYSLKGWDFSKNVSEMPSSTRLGDAINRINSVSIKCIYSYSFFQYCVATPKDNFLYEFLNKELPKKNWLSTLSENRKNKKKTVGKFFNQYTSNYKCSSLFNCIKTLDVSKAYSTMQYVEGYYLIQESVKKALSNDEKKVQIAFVLPKGEDKYYFDYPKDLEKMLRLDFGKDLCGLDIAISFQFFEYRNYLNSRPYIINSKNDVKVKPAEIAEYFNYLN